MSSFTYSFSYGDELQIATAAIADLTEISCSSKEQLQLYTSHATKSDCNWQHPTNYTR